MSILSSDNWITAYNVKILYETSWSVNQLDRMKTKIKVGNFIWKVYTSSSPPPQKKNKKKKEKASRCILAWLINKQFFEKSCQTFYLRN